MSDHDVSRCQFSTRGRVKTFPLPFTSLSLSHNYSTYLTVLISASFVHQATIAIFTLAHHTSEYLSASLLLFLTSTSSHQHTTSLIIRSLAAICALDTATSSHCSPAEQLPLLEHRLESHSLSHLVPNTRFVFAHPYRSFIHRTTTAAQTSCPRRLPLIGQSARK